MKNKVLQLSMFTTVLLALTALEAQEQKPIIWSLDVAGKTATVQPGKTIELSALAELEPGWHVFSVTQPPGGPITTRFTLPAGQRFQAAGPVRQPTPKKMFDENFGIQTEFFEEKVSFVVPCKAAANARPGKQQVGVEVYYQVCNDSLCMPPETLKLRTTVTVSPAAASKQ